jgi:hypothetical protein
MKKLITTTLTLIVLSLGVFASIAAAANGNGGLEKGGTNTCQPSFHDEGGTCVHNGDAAGNCGQNQSGDTRNGNGSNEGNGGDKGYGNQGSCDASAGSPPPPSSPPPPVAPPAAPPAPTSLPPAAPGPPQTTQTSAPTQQQSAGRGSFKPPAAKHKAKKSRKRHAAANKGIKALLVSAKAPRKAPFTK